MKSQDVKRVSAKPYLLIWDDPGMGRTSRTLKIDEILDLLSHSHRRALLRTLKNHDDNLITFGERFNTLIEIEAQCAGKQMEENQYIAALVHYHGPKLREAGLVDYVSRVRRFTTIPTSASKLV